ncbi:MAG: hypothetical protein N4J56_001489 [Chroococcidiopsis sp. SAG 2025]|uniref:esterase-like activity of phytase family protein n=1 Tax=Chroococcidiopsis sp. SAG 2025 TaxID=171389 RepID=UPI00293700B8|nr:esterase-like activity of phytase family protein [Chroococcidiopsis sp. SAG 2025]MDV2991835.1 hypothetical protein [Chroococcidiopsis sp. SAG 2025]
MEFIFTQAKSLSTDLNLKRFLRACVDKFCPCSGDFNRLFMQVILVSAIAFLSLLSFATPALAAKDRLFLDLSLDYLGEYQLPTTNISHTPVTEFSAITYDKRRDRFYAVSGNEIVTLKLSFAPDPEEIKIQDIELESVTSLTDKDGKVYESDTFFAKGVALTPQQTLYVSGSQISGDRTLPFIREFDLKTGKMLQSLTLPKRYIPEIVQEKEQNQNTKITQNNISFAALAFNATGTVPTSGEPINLFTATESTLVQDRDTPNSNPNSKQGKARLLHYLIGYGTPMLLAEYAYPLDAEIGELLSVEGVHFLSLELQPAAKTGKIYQIVTSGATDTSKVESLKGKVRGVREIKKKLVLDLQELGISLENASGMTFGSRLADRTKSLLLMSNDRQVTKFLLFRLRYQ